MSHAKQHWDDVYERKDPERVSWFRPHLETSLHFVHEANITPDAAIIDVGAGASTFVDDLLALGFSKLTILDISQAALETARRRLGPQASQVSWICADITESPLSKHAYDLWHDRAVFHFLTEASSRARYIAKVRHSVKPGGHVVIATFGPQGPSQCSGLDVMRFSSDEIHAEFGEQFAKVGQSTEIHQTPWGSEQEFTYCYCRLGDGVDSKLNSEAP